MAARLEHAVQPHPSPAGAGAGAGTGTGGGGDCGGRRVIPVAAASDASVAASSGDRGRGTLYARLASSERASSERWWRDAAAAAAATAPLVAVAVSRLGSTVAPGVEKIRFNFTQIVPGTSYWVAANRFINAIN